MKKCNHEFVYFGGEARCKNCYAEGLPSGTVIPWTKAGKPPFINFMESKENKTQNNKMKIIKGLLPWTNHLKKVRAENPKLTLKEAMKKASKTYKKKKK